MAYLIPIPPKPQKPHRAEAKTTKPRRMASPVTIDANAGKSVGPFTVGDVFKETVKGRKYRYTLRGVELIQKSDGSSRWVYVWGGQCAVCTAPFKCTTGLRSIAGKLARTCRAHRSQYHLAAKRNRGCWGKKMASRGRGEL